jgi:hypothetical protein
MGGGTTTSKLYTTKKNNNPYLNQWEGENINTHIIFEIK